MEDIDFLVDFVPNPNFKNWVWKEIFSCALNVITLGPTRHRLHFVRDKSCYWKCHKGHIENLGNMMGTLWELDQNTIENLGNLMGTPWELIRTQLEFGELDGNTLRTWSEHNWELGEPTGNTLRTWWEHIGNRQKTTPPETPSDCQRPHFLQQQREREGENMGVWENMGMLERKERRTWAMGLDDWVRFWERTWVCSYLL